MASDELSSSEDVPRSEFTSNIRPLSAEEYVEILASHDVELRISDGTPEGTYRFWLHYGQLYFRRLSWTQNKPTDSDFLRTILDGDGTTQLVAEGSQ